MIGLDKHVAINLEKSKKKGLTGCTTAVTIRKIIADTWDNLNANQQHQLCEDLITISDKKGLKNRLAEHWKLPTDQAIALATTDLDKALLIFHLKHAIKYCRC